MKGRQRLLTPHSMAKAEPSKEPGPLPELKWISKHLIDIDDRYQREVGTRGGHHVNDILRDFKWRYFQTLTVTPNKDRYFAIDGQHRWLAAMKHPDVDKVPCCVIEEIDFSAAASVFEALNGKRLGITNLVRFHVQLAAGDKTAMRLDYLCGEAGVRILKTQPQGFLPPLTLIAIGTLRKLLFRGDAVIIKALSAISDVWKDKNNGFRAHNVYAVVTCVGRAGPDYDDARFRKVLLYWDDGVEYLTAHSTRSKTGGVVEQLLADQMWEKYMKGKL